MWLMRRALAFPCRSNNANNISACQKFNKTIKILSYSTNSKQDTPSPADKVKESIGINNLKKSASSKFNFNFIGFLKEKSDTVVELLGEISGQKQSEVAQKRVTEVQEKFFIIQENRRSVQKELSNVQSRLKAATAALEKTNRGDAKYLDLIKDEHQIIVEENRLIDKLRENDELERAQLSYLGEAIRKSHEADQDKDERMKSISLVFTCGSIILGILSLCYYHYRCIELQNTVKSFTESRENMKVMITQLADSMSSQNEKTEEFLQDLKSALGSETSGLKQEPSIQKSSKNVNPVTSNQSEMKLLEKAMLKQENILSDINEVKLLLGFEKSKENENNVVYVGPNLENILKETETNIEWKMKMNSLATVAFVYGALALTIPVIISVLSGK